MLPRVLEKLEWPILLTQLAELGQTEDGKRYLLGLQPNLSKEKIQERWNLVEPLRQMASHGYRAPIGELPKLDHIFRAASLGQMLAGEELREVHSLLEATEKVHHFATDFAEKCSTLKKFRARLYPMPALIQAINKAVGPTGELRDDASEELQKVRRQKQSVRKRIEDTLKKILHEGELEKYLQDDFFTVRSERYVVPMRLDGRGRVKGSILDTSDSGQTLYIEPAAITPINDQLQELDLAEKLEILRIFRELSALVATDAETLKDNYAELVELDWLSAMAQLACDQDSGPVTIVESPKISLVNARHPLLRRPDGNPAVSNSVDLSATQSTLIISGPNAGGKTVVLKTVGLIHIMIQAGLLVPADDTSEVFLFKNIFLEMGDAQNLAANLSTFSGHIIGLKPIVESSQSGDLVLLDELAVGTDPQTGAAIARALLEDLASRSVHTLVTTHFDDLKSLAVSDKRFRNGSMEFSVSSLKPTYKLILDVPGQSYGVEVAEEMGLPAKIIARAKELRGYTVSALDEAVSQLMEARDLTRSRETELTKSRMEADMEKGRWQQERELLAQERGNAAREAAERYEEQISKIKAEYDEIVKSMRRTVKESEQSNHGDVRETLISKRHEAKDKIKEMDSVVAGIIKSVDYGDDLPGRPAEYVDLKVGTNVFVLPVKKQGTVIKVGAQGEQIEVQVGILKLKISLHDLRALPESNKKNSAAKSIKKPPTKKGGRLDQNIELTLQSPRNSIDLRGQDADRAIESTWNFIDRALLRGEPAIILIHGHGEGVLQRTIRDALKNNCPYDVKFRPGGDQEGGDGVTIVELKS